MWTDGAFTGTGSASDAHRPGVASNRADTQTLGAVRRRITGKRGPTVRGRGPPTTVAEADNKFTLHGYDAAGADEGIVAGASPVLPCDLVHHGRTDGGVEQSSVDSGPRLRADISVGSTRALECLSSQGIGLAHFGAAAHGELNTQKYTLSCPSSSANGGAGMLQRDAVTRLGDQAGRAAACGAVDARASSLTPTRGLPPECAG
jgi:hypothetical protein